MTDPAKLAPAAILAITMLIAACESTVTVQPTPEVIIPPGVISTQTADQVVQRTLAMIADNEQQLGRRLAEPRIVRVQLLRAGEVYPFRRLDGTGDFGEVGPGAEGPGWMVESIGTFVELTRDLEKKKGGFNFFSLSYSRNEPAGSSHTT